MQNFRSKRHQYATAFLFGLIILSFVLWGGYQMDPTSPSALTTVNGEEIPYQEFNRVYQMQLESYGQVFGGGKPLSDSIAQLVERQVASGLVMQTLMAQKAADLGIEIGDQEILNLLQENKAFHDPEKGRFSPSIYTRVLEANNLKPANFENQIRKDLASQRFRHLIEASLIVSDEEIADSQRIRNASMSLDVAKIGIGDLRKAGRLKFDQAKLKSFYESRKGEFLSTTKKKATVVALSEADILSSLTPTPEEIKSFYDSTVKTADSPEWKDTQAHAYHILISDPSPEGLSQIQKIQAEIQAAGPTLENFMKAAIKNSEDYSNASKGGDLGYFDEKRMVKPFSEAVFKNSKIQKILGPVKTDYGYHLIWVEDRVSKTDFESRKKQMAYSLIQQKLPARTAEIQKTAESLLKGSPDKNKDQLMALGFRWIETGPLDHQSRSVDFPFLLVQEISAKAVGGFGEIKNLSGGLYAFRVNEEIKPQQLDFNTARTQVEKKMEQAEAERVIREDYEALKAGKLSWADLSKRGATLTSNKNVKTFQIQQVPGLGESEPLLRAAQSLGASQPLSNLLTHEGNWVILRGSNFSATNADAASPEKLSAREDLLSKKRSQILNSYIDQAMKDARIPEGFRKKYNL